MKWPQESRFASLHGGDPFSALAQLKSETAAVWQKDPSHLCTADITFLSPRALSRIAFKNGQERIYCYCNKEYSR